MPIDLPKQGDYDALKETQDPSTFSGDYRGPDVLAATAGPGGGIVLPFYSTCPHGPFYVAVGRGNGSSTAWAIGDHYLTGSLAVFVNGILQRITTDWAEANPDVGSFTFVTAPQTNDYIDVIYGKYCCDGLVSTPLCPDAEPLGPGTVGEIFCAPGRNDVTDTLADLYKRSDAGVWTVFAQFSGANPALGRMYVSLCFWHPTLSKFYVFVSDNNGVNKPKMWELHTTTAVAVDLGLDDTLHPSSDPSTERSYVIHGCMHQGAAYFIGQQSHEVSGNRGVIYKWDGATLSRVYVHNDSSTPVEQGIASDGTTMYAAFGGEVYSSADGTTWALDELITSTIGTSAQARMIYNTAAGKFHFGGVEDAATPDNAAVLARNGSWAIDERVDDAAVVNAAVNGIGLRYQSAIPTTEYVMSRRTAGAGEVFIWQRSASSSGTFDATTGLPNLAGSVQYAGKRFGIVDNSIFLLVYRQTPTTLEIFSRGDDASAWVSEHNFNVALTPYSISGTFVSSGLYEAGVSVSQDRI